jgi:hypothetical protein
MALVEAAVSLIGLGLAAKLVDSTLVQVLGAAGPGLKLAVVCAMAALAGKELAVASGLNGFAVLLAEALPALAVFLWMETSLFLGMIDKAFGAASSQPA